MFVYVYMCACVCVYGGFSLLGKENGTQESADKKQNIFFFVWNLYVMWWKFDSISFFIVDEMPRAIASICFTYSIRLSPSPFLSYLLFIYTVRKIID